MFAELGRTILERLSFSLFLLKVAQKIIRQNPLFGLRGSGVVRSAAWKRGDEAVWGSDDDDCNGDDEDKMTMIVGTVLRSG